MNEKIEINETWNGLFSIFLEIIELDDYGSPGFENEFFYVKPYLYDIECSCGMENNNWNEHSDKCNLMKKEGFYYKPTGFCLTWYKYPLRSAECNMQITNEEFFDIICHCVESFRRKN